MGDRPQSGEGAPRDEDVIRGVAGRGIRKSKSKGKESQRMLRK